MKHKIFIGLIVLLLSVPITAYAEPLKVSSTAYSNPKGNKTYSGYPTVTDMTAAGKKSWLWRDFDIYECKSNGEMGDFIETRTFMDTGYGVDSKKYPGKGTIQTGEQIDIFIPDEQEAKKYGRKDVYIVFLENE